MALIDGDEFVTGDFLSFQEGNRLKDHWVQSDPQANLGNPQEGMIVYDSDDGKLYLRQLAAYIEIATGAVADEKVKVDAAAVAGYLGALFNDGVLRVAQDELTFVDGGDFVTLGLADHNTARAALGLIIGTDVLANIVEDATPQLGGDLDLNGKNIDFPTTPNISDCLDEDNMVSDSPTKLATQQSIKAYVDAAGGGDKIEEGNSSVEVIDLGVGYIETKADAQQVRKDAVLGNIQPLQPAFFAYNSVTDANVTGDGTIFTMDANIELYDQGGNYANPTFTAPITGKYFLNYGFEVSGILAANANFYVLVSTSNRDYKPQSGDSWRMAEGTGGNMNISGTLLVDLDAGDTAVVKIAVQDGLKVVDIIGHVNDPKTYIGMTLQV